MIRNFFVRIFHKTKSQIATESPIISEPEIETESPAVVEQSLIGFVDELNSSYSCGWVCDRALPHSRLICEAVLQTTQEVIASAIADGLHYETIKNIGDGTCRYAFFIKFSDNLTEEDQKQVIIRVKNTDYIIPTAPNLKTEFQPFLHIAMDIVNNCNLRCPFCLYDYSSVKKTYFMDEKTIDSVLRFLPFIPDGDFWFSCLHEPTLHPQLIKFIDKVPADYRKKIFFTTNLAKKMPNDFFEFIVNSELHHINISLESFNLETYERLRKGARQHIFTENMMKLQQAYENADSPVAIQYIIMAYQSNLKELPEMLETLFGRYHASHVEVRNSFDTPFISRDFKENEFLKASDWDWLAAQVNSSPNANSISVLRDLTKEESEDHSLQEAKTEGLCAAESGGISKEENMLTGRYMLRLSWDGHLKVFKYIYSQISHKKTERNILEMNINDINDITDINKFYEKLIRIKNN